MNISKVITVTPTLTVGANHVTGDYVGTSSSAIEFTGVATIQTNSIGGISATLIDGGANTAAMELWLFDGSVTPPADSAAWSISDDDAKKCIGVIPFSTFYSSALNSVANGSEKLLGCSISGTSLYGCLVARGTLTSPAVTVRLFIWQD
jgi:hypothetical protein